MFCSLWMSAFYLLHSNKYHSKEPGTLWQNDITTTLHTRGLSGLSENKNFVYLRDIEHFSVKFRCSIEDLHQLNEEQLNLLYPLGNSMRLWAYETDLLRKAETLSCDSIVYVALRDVPHFFKCVIRYKGPLKNSKTRGTFFGLQLLVIVLFLLIYFWTCPRKLKLCAWNVVREWIKKFAEFFNSS